MNAPTMKLSRTIYAFVCNPTNVKSSEGLCLLGQSRDHTRKTTVEKPCTRNTDSPAITRRVYSRPRSEAEYRQKFRENTRVANDLECWEWQGRISIPIRGQDYGVMRYQGKRRYAHRLSWLFHFGPIPEGMVVMHSCDNARCVNPTHLRIGTQGENMRECKIKGRASRERGRRSKLTLETVNEWRRMFQEDPMANSCVKLANEFGVAMATMRRAVTGKHFRQLRAAKRMAQEVLPLTA